MSWREQVDRAIEASLALSSDGVLALILSLAVLLALTMGLTLRKRRRQGDRLTKDDLTPSPADRIVPLGRVGFLALIVVISAGCWLAGYLLATDRAMFFASKEWQIQPLYIAAHLVTLRLFVAVFARNFRMGIVWLDVQSDKVLAGMHQILGPAGAACAFGIAIPFCASDYSYLHSDRYERLDPQAPIGVIDHVMWGIWSAEWFLNAFIWVILVGFLAKNIHILRNHQFIAPIEQVLQERHYRPFLRMSSQGASVVLGFSIITVLYIGYTGGAVTDYMGLGITAVLLVIGFLVPWTMLKRKVRQCVEAEQGRLQSSLGQPSGLYHTESTGLEPSGDTASALPDLDRLAHRLEYVVSLVRIDYLERLHLKVGATEARAIAIRLVAPAATIGWQALQNYKPAMEQITKIMKDLLARMIALLG